MLQNEKVKANVVEFYEGLNAKIKKESNKYNIDEEVENDEVLKKEREMIAEFEKQYQKGVYELSLGVRPEDVVSGDKGDINIDTGVVELLGAQLIVHGKYKDNDIVATLSANANVKPHSKMKISFFKDNIHLFIKNEDGKAIF